MDTINKVVSGASNMVFGENNKPTESGQEPVSGETGSGTTTAPFDKGNAAEGHPQNVTGQSTSDSTSGTSGLKNTSESDPIGSNDGPTTSGGAASAVNTQGNIRPEHETDKTGVTSANQPSTYGGDIKPSEANEAQPNKNAGGFGVAEPSVGADPKSAQKPAEEHQTTGNPAAEPKGEEESAVKEKKDEAEAALQKRDPNDHSGEPLKVHDGSEKVDRSQSIGQPGGGEHGKEKGTGEEWVKTSGLAAEGGDFDATKPGAGREATRLLEQKGIHRDAPGDAHPPAEEASHDSSAGGDKADKPKLTEKIKDKLHLGKKDHSES